MDVSSSMVRVCVDAMSDDYYQVWCVYVTPYDVYITKYDGECSDIKYV